MDRRTVLRLCAVTLGALATDLRTGALAQQKLVLKAAATPPSRRW